MRLSRNTWIDFAFALRHSWVRVGLASAAAVMVLLVLLVFAYWRPAYHRHAALAERVGSLRKDLVAAMRDEELTRTYDKTQKDIVRLEKKLDAESGQAALVDNVTNLARQSHVNVISESYEEGHEDSGYVPLFQVIALQGGYEDIRDFLRGVQCLPTWTVVRETRLERLHDSQAVKAILTLVTYRKAAKQIGS
ncbi:MAG TPA: type 4a pilus biogenesis protein PilO [Gammaproteobacteria bacterium]|nr:type 4a pilus biogenesis protein PilO [Gammaproteobacteria bacterium]